MNAQTGQSYFHTVSSLSALRGERWHRSTIHTWISNIPQKYRNTTTTNNNNNNNNNNNYYYYYYNDKNTINSNSNDNNDSNNKHRNEKGRV